MIILFFLHYTQINVVVYGNNSNTKVMEKFNIRKFFLCFFILI